MNAIKKNKNTYAFVCYQISILDKLDRTGERENLNCYTNWLQTGSFYIRSMFLIVPKKKLKIPFLKSQTRTISDTA